MQWEDIPQVIDDWAEKIAAPAWDVKRHAAGVITSSHFGYYYHPALEKVAVYAPLASKDDLSRVKAACERAVGKAHVRSLSLTYQELADPCGQWVKVAYSQALRRAGELLNFFPGQLPGGIPNAPSPVASMLTTGLIGAGLGWGTGKLLGGLLPEGYGYNLGRTGLILGGALGAAPGAAWGLTNKSIGKDFNDNSLLNSKPTDEPVLDTGATWMHGGNANYTNQQQGLGAYEDAIKDYVEDVKINNKRPSLPRFGKRGEDAFAQVELGERYRRAVAVTVEKMAYEFGPANWNDSETFGQQPAYRPPTPIDVNINTLGQTLWSSGASPQLTGATMGAMYAAQQMPDPNSRPGWATGHQLGQLAQNAAGNYAKGLLAGAAINAAIGTPFSAPTFGLGAAALGVVGAVVPKLFGG